MKQRSTSTAIALATSLLAFAAGNAFAQDKAQNAAQAVDGFLYFKDEAPQAESTDGASGAELTADFLSNRPIFTVENSGLLDSTTGFVGLFTPRKIDSQIGIWFDADGEEDSFDGQFSQYITPRASSLKLSFHSQLDVGPNLLLTAAFNPGAEQAFDRQQVRLGVGADYRGFGFNAAFIREDGAFNDQSYGFDAGVSYAARSWRTSLQVTGAQVERASNFIDLGGLYDRSYAVQFGAAYDLTPGWSLTGGLRYSGVHERFDFGLDKSKTDSRVFMGTALSF